MFPRLKVCAIAMIAGLFVAAPQSPVLAKKGGVCATLNAINPDNDGTIDMNEAKQAASATFDRLDKDKEGTLSIKELQGRLSKKDFAAGDPDKDKTLTKDEYLAIVAERFKAADANSEGSVDCTEAKSPAGQALFRLLK
jgi:Ca2+-binding EF-hand superfamily protein